MDSFKDLHIHLFDLDEEAVRWAKQVMDFPDEEVRPSITGGEWINSGVQVGAQLELLPRKKTYQCHH